MPQTNRLDDVLISALVASLILCVLSFTVLSVVAWLRLLGACA